MWLFIVFVVFGVDVNDVWEDVCVYYEVLGVAARDARDDEGAFVVACVGVVVLYVFV